MHRVSGSGVFGSVLDLGCVLCARLVLRATRAVVYHVQPSGQYFSGRARREFLRSRRCPEPSESTINGRGAGAESWRMKRLSVYSGRDNRGGVKARDEGRDGWA